MRMAALAVLLCAPCYVNAQEPEDKASQKSMLRKPGNAWTLVTPMGLRQASTIDTLEYNYQHQFIPAQTSDAYASTGQLTGPGLDMIYFGRHAAQPFFFNDAIYKWVPSFEKEKFYNVYIPMTLLSYNFSTGRETHSDLLRGVFAGNVNRRIGAGAWVEYPYTKGCYADQAAKELAYGFQVYYNGDHYQMQAFYNHYNHLNKENGGITDDRYITDPAAVQGGVNEIDAKSIPVRLSDVHNRVRGQEFYMSHAYSAGFHREITQPGDTVPRFELVPVTRFVYSLNVEQNDRRFLAQNMQKAQEFWQDTYFNASVTDELTKHWSVTNSFGVQMVEGFHKWIPFGLSAWVSYDIDKWWFRREMPAAPEEGVTPGQEQAQDDTGLTPLPEGIDFNPVEQRNRLWVGARLERTQGKIIRFYAQGRLGLVGSAAGEIDVNGNITTRFRLGRDTVEIAAHAAFKNEEPNWILKHYIGNHFIWDNNFGKIRSLRIGGHLHIPWTKTDIRVNFENVQNMVYFNARSLPEQYGGSVQVFAASIEQQLQFGIWNWNNRVTYQATSDKMRLPLPALSIYSNMFLQFRIAKVLKVQLGIDCDYYTKYRGMLYQPATMSFHVQGEDAIEVGNYANCNVYLTCKLSKTRFFVMCSHVNQGLFGRDYFSMPGYPVSPRQFRLGVSVDFAN